jgi:hypothetical protein
MNMKNLRLLIIVLFVLVPTLLYADDFLGCPVISGGKVVVSSDSRLEKDYDMGYDEVVAFYKKALKSEKYVKFWDRGDSIYIEDHLDRPWHSVTISKTEKDGTKVVCLKDNWTWIMGTLTLRFVGVFAVLAVLYIALSISGTIISRTVKAEGKG